MKKAIFWDSDGTLLYGNESFRISLMRSFSEYGYSLDEDDARSFMKRVCSWYMPEMDHSDKDGKEWWEELLGKIVVFCDDRGVAKLDVPSICKAFRNNVIKYEYEMYPNAKIVLHHFNEKGYENYIISNNFPELAEVFKRLALDDYISGYFLSANIGYEKPRKEIFEYAILNAGNPEIKYMIGDNPIADYQGGLNAGMIPILVHNTVEGAMCYEHLTDLMDVIKE